MYSSKLKLFSLITLAFCLLGVSLNAQEKNKENDKQKKVVIIKKTVDKDGNETVEKIVRDGEDAEELIWMNQDGDVIELERGDFEFFDEEDMPNLDEIESIDVIKIEDGEMTEEIKERLEELEIDLEQIEDGETRIRILKKTDEGPHKVIEWEGEMNDEMLEKLQEEGIHIKHLDKDENRVFFHSDGGHSNRAFMGVMMNRTVEVINENGEETVIEEGDEVDGVIVGGVVEGSGAEAAGLQEGDILKKVDGQTIDEFDDLVNILDEKSPGDVVAVEYEREGQRSTVEVTLGNHENISLGDLDEEIEITIDLEGEDMDEENVFFFKHDNGAERKVSKKKIIIIDKKEGLPKEIEEAPELELERSLELDEFEAFPNPTSGELRVKFKAQPVSTVVRITDLSGREIYREELQGFDGNYEDTIDLGEMAKGTLLLLVSQEEKVYSEKIILK